ELGLLTGGFGELGFGALGAAAQLANLVDCLASLLRRARRAGIGTLYPTRKLLDVLLTPLPDQQGPRNGNDEGQQGQPERAAPGRLRGSGRLRRGGRRRLRRSGSTRRGRASRARGACRSSCRLGTGGRCALGFGLRRAWRSTRRAALRLDL